MRISTAAATGVAGLATAALALSITGTSSATAASAPQTTPGAAKAAAAVPGPTGTNRVIGLTDEGVLVAFDYGTPSKIKTFGAVKGFDGDTKLVGIDFRVKTGQLYGLGEKGGVYTIAAATATATKVSQLSVALDGDSFGVDFNPAADRLRVISNTGQSLRHDVTQAAPTTNVDGTLTYTAPPVGNASPTPITPATGVTGAAYTNNDNDAVPAEAKTGTTLFDLDTALDQVALQSPANNGILVSTGKLGVDAGTDAGFDIATGLTDGRAVNNVAYAALSVGDKYGFYEVSLLSGQVTKKGSFPASTQVVDIALKLQK